MNTSCDDENSMATWVFMGPAGFAGKSTVAGKARLRGCDEGFFDSSRIKSTLVF